jgi:hypothetical protein
MSYVDIVVLFIFRGNIVEASYILFCEKGHCRKILYFIHAPLCSIAKKKIELWSRTSGGLPLIIS